MKRMALSIVARCRETGNIGAAGVMCYPAAGAHFSRILSKYGAVITQGWINPTLGPKGLHLLQNGNTANETLTQLLDEDPGRELRQLSVLDRYGNCAAYTGLKNEEWRGHIIGESFSIQGTAIEGMSVLKEMQMIFEQAEGPLSERLLRAIEIGDKLVSEQQKQSAVLNITVIDEFPFIDYRVDDHHQPVQELRRIYEKHKEDHTNRYFAWIDAVKQGVN